MINIHLIALCGEMSVYGAHYQCYYNWAYPTQNCTWFHWLYGSQHVNIINVILNTRYMELLTCAIEKRTYEYIYYC